MIRVLYRWRCRAGQEAPFRRAWARLTRAIRRSRPGARGSVLLRSRANPRELVAVASWTSYRAWRRAGALRPVDPAAAATMRVAARFLSTEVFDEVRDLVARPRRRAKPP